MIISRTFTFEAAHFLSGHKKCGRVHGHSYKLEVSLKGPVAQPSGIVCEFGNLKRVVEHEVLKELDHNLLNYTENPVLGRPTCENLALWIWHRLKSAFDRFERDRLFRLYEVKVWETVDSCATYRGAEE